MDDTPFINLILPASSAEVIDITDKPSMALTKASARESATAQYSLRNLPYPALRVVPAATRPTAMVTAKRSADAQRYDTNVVGAHWVHR